MHRGKPRLTSSTIRIRWQESTYHIPGSSLSLTISGSRSECPANRYWHQWGANQWKRNGGGGRCRIQVWPVGSICMSSGTERKTGVWLNWFKHVPQVELYLQIIRTRRKLTKMFNIQVRRNWHFSDYFGFKDSRTPSLHLLNSLGVNKTQFDNPGPKRFG